MDLVDRMLEYDRWAMLQLLVVSQNLTDDQLDQSFDIGHETIRQTFDHIIFNIAVWTWQMAGRPNIPDPRAERQHQSVPELIERFERHHAWYASFIRQKRDEARLSDTFVDDFGGTPTFGGLAIHLPLHHAEHRSEILHILRRLGIDNLPEIDMALWDQTAQVVLSQIQAERDLWHELVAAVGEDRMEEPGPMGEWTFKDLAGHLLGWRERTIARIEAGPNSNPPTPWPAELESDDDINAWIYEQHRNRPLRDVLDDMDRSYDRLADAIRRVPEGDLTNPGRFGWLGETRLFEVDFADHLREEHEPSIRTWLASR